VVLEKQLLGRDTTPEHKYPQKDWRFQVIWLKCDTKL